MTREDLNQLITNGDLENFCARLISEIKRMIEERSGKKEFYRTQEFSKITGIKYSTVVYHCKTGKLKARQDHP